MAQRINLPEHLVGGTYANGVRVKFSRSAFILDFIVHNDASADPDEWIVVDRVRLDPTSVQNVLASLSGMLGEYEAKFGDPRPAD